MGKINTVQISGTSYSIEDSEATKVVNVTQAEYDALVTGGTVDPTALYNITDATAVDISQYWNSAETQSAITQATSGKQDTLVSGTNIKTINNESLLGSGNIDIQGGGGVNVVQTTGISTTDVMSQDAVTTQLNGKQDSSKLPPYIVNNVDFRENKVIIGETIKSNGGQITNSNNVITINNQAIFNNSNLSNLSLVETSAITSAVTSTSTDSEVPSAKAVYDAIQEGGGGGKAVSGGTNISITTGETADTINCTLPITATSNNSLIFLTSNTNRNITNSIVGGNDNDVKNTQYSFIFGQSNTLNGITTRANIIGFGNKSYKSDTFVGGIYNKALNQYETDFGVYNNSVSASTTFGDSGNTLFSVGNGTANNARHNAFEIRQNGDIYVTKNGQDIKLQDNLGSTIEVSSAITSGDTNPVQGGAIYDELRVETPTQVEVVLEWEQHDGGESTNYPNGCTKLTVEVDENEMASGKYTLQNDNYDCFGTFQIESNNGVITVTTDDCNSNPSTSITYSISGNVVTIEYPTITGVTIIGTNYDNYWTFKAIIEGEVKSLKEYTYDKFDEVEQVTAAGLNALNDRVSEDEEVTAASLNALNDNFGGMKLVKLTEAEYNALATKDSSTLYIIFN